MREAYRLTRKDGAPGIDGVTAAEYAQNLEANLSDLLERMKSGRYQAPPVRRVYIPKGVEAGLLRPSAFQPSKIRWRKGRLSWCWRPSMSRTFFPARTASGRVALLIKPCRRCVPAS